MDGDKFLENFMDSYGQLVYCFSLFRERDILKGLTLKAKIV